MIGTDAPLAGLLRRCASQGADRQLLSPVLRQELDQALNILVRGRWAKTGPLLEHLVGFFLWRWPFAPFVDLPSIYSCISRSGDAETHAVAPDINDGNADLFINNDLFADFPREHNHSSSPGHHPRGDSLVPVRSGTAASHRINLREPPPVIVN